MTEGPVVNCQFDVIRTSKCWGQIVNFFDKLLKTSGKDSLEMQKIENWTTVASCTELTEATW